MWSMFCLSGMLALWVAYDLFVLSGGSVGSLYSVCSIWWPREWPVFAGLSLTALCVAYAVLVFWYCLKYVYCLFYGFWLLGSRVSSH
jgi:hypothetical protein